MISCGSAAAWLVCRSHMVQVNGGGCVQVHALVQIIVVHWML